MKNFKLPFAISRFNFALLASILFLLFFNGPIIFLRIKGVEQLSLTLAIFSEISLMFAANFLLFLLLVQLRIFGKILLIVLSLISSAASYFIVNYGVTFDQGTMVSIFATTKDEALGLLHLYTVLVILLTPIIPVGFILFTKFKPRKFSRKTILKNALITLLLFILPLAFNYRIYREDDFKKVMLSYLPFNYTYATGKYFTKTRKSLKVAQNRVNLYEKYGASISGNKDLTVVLVIGESARRSNFSLNGYERETNPDLKKIPNLISFKNTTSCARYTQYAVPCLMTRVGKKNFAFPLKETSLVSIFTGLGFDTYWYDVQSAFSSNEMPIFQIALEAKERLFRDGFRSLIPADKELYDEQLLPPFKAALNSSKQKRSLIVLHTEGSHYDYSKRYPQEFEIYTPTCRKPVNKCSKPEIVNIYDNTILYTDYFLSRVITELKNKNALVLYISDHAESLGEGGVFLHGTEIHEGHMEQYEIPMIWWASDKFLADPANRKKFSKLKQKTGVVTSSDNVFHSLIDCAGARSEAVNKGLSLCE